MITDTDRKAKDLVIEYGLDLCDPDTDDAEELFYEDGELTYQEYFRLVDFLGALANPNPYSSDWSIADILYYTPMDAFIVFVKEGFYYLRVWENDSNYAYLQIDEGEPTLVNIEETIEGIVSKLT